MRLTKSLIVMLALLGARNLRADEPPPPPPAAVETPPATPPETPPVTPPVTPPAVPSVTPPAVPPATTTAPGTPAAPAAPAEPPAPKWWESVAFSGFVDSYLGVNFNRPKSRGNVLRNFDIRTDEASLAGAELVIERKPADKSPVGFRLDLDFGPSTDLIHAGEKVPPPGGMGGPPVGTSTFNHLQQAYAVWIAPVGKGLELDFGKFVTIAGAEVIEAKDNWNYSRSLLFSWAIPYYHAGVRATYPFSDKVSGILMVTNGWNNVVDNNNGKTVGAAVSYTDGGLSVFADYIGGPELANSSKFRHLADATVTYKKGKAQVYVNGDFGIDTNKIAGTSPKWYGVAAAGRYQTSSKCAVAARGEWFKDAQGLQTGVAETVFEGTLTGEYAPADGLLLRAEFRLDHSSVSIFEDKNGALDKKNQPTIALAAIASF